MIRRLLNYLRPSVATRSKRAISGFTDTLRELQEVNKVSRQQRIDITKKCDSLRDQQTALESQEIANAQIIDKIEGILN